MSNAKYSDDSIKNNTKEDGYYGVLDTRNFRRVVFGEYEFDTWYGNAAYFNPQSHSELGFEYSNKSATMVGQRNRKNIHTHANPIALSSKDEHHYWFDKLYVCEYCFKYASKLHVIQQHRIACKLNIAYPTIGKLLYRDDDTPYLIRQVRGFKHLLFCQNLSLFSKLFLEDKSVYYNVDYFDFYVVYGYDDYDYKNLEPNRVQHFKPMGFFSKEVSSWDNDNNLACICIFPPYQRRRLGSLLIEFSYALAKETPGQLNSGPEFPLSPYGKVSYLKYWSKKLSNVIVTNLKPNMEFMLDDLSDLTGFRKEDILITLEYMKILKKDEVTGEILLLLGNLEQWCKENKVDSSQDKSMLNVNCLLF